ncbi:MAG: VWA domain-containing protein [Gemmatimonadetes bacterium]|nr:VWA domain-containing protein [Gemmatimonadota bacterium]
MSAEPSPGRDGTRAADAVNTAIAADAEAVAARAGADGGDLVAATVRLCRALRRRDVRATTGETLTAVRALARVDVADRREVYLALRAVLVGRVEEYAAFDAAFRETWGGGAPPVSAPRRPKPAGAAPAAEAEPPAARGAHGRAAALTLQRWLRGAEASGEPAGVPLASAREALAEKDFASFSADELEAVTRVAARLARRLAARPSRRWVASRRGPRVHPHRTLRRALRTAGDAVELALRERKPKRVKLVLLCDVSGSMDLYSRFLLQFLYALQNCFARVETFVFATRLSRVTERLRGPSYRRALDRLSRDVRDWSGGTRIGASLAAFAAGWPRLLDRRTIVVILSDGWDTGEPAQLVGALRAFRRRAGKIVWLNPLLGSPDYRPLTRGMQAALPHVDVFAPVHNLASLRALVDHFRL